MSDSGANSFISLALNLLDTPGEAAVPQLSLF